MGLAAAGFLSGCDDNPLGALCCSGFEVGADLSGVDFKAGVEFNAFMQATADFAGTASAMITNVTNACRALAIDLGEDENAVDTTDPEEAAKQWCAAAAAQISANVQGSVSVRVQPPVCSINASVQANCEASCTANLECEAELGNIEARCDPGQLSGKCSAECSGTCEGSANLAVSCEGTCQGTCTGSCSAACSSETPSGDCNGECAGTCNGECRGSCQVAGGASVECEGQCTGGCSVDLQAPKCKAELTPPSAECSGSADCNASCEASASAKAECTPPSVVVEANASAQVLGSLRMHLPALYLVVLGQFELMIENVGAMADLALSIDLGSLSIEAAACIPTVAGTIGQAAGNIQASFDAAFTVTGGL